LLGSVTETLTLIGEYAYEDDFKVRLRALTYFKVRLRANGRWDLAQHLEV